MTRAVRDFTEGVTETIVLIGKNFRRTPNRVIILCLLNTSETPLTGYEIMKATKFSSGIIYPSLNAFESKGFIRKTENEEGKLKFSVTEEGSKLAREWRHQIFVEEIGVSLPNFS